MQPAGAASRKSYSFHNQFTKYFIATRPWSFSASLTPVLLGNVIAYIETHNLNITLAIISLACVLTVHCAGNLVNTFYDFHAGVDQKNSDDVTLVHGILRPDEVKILIVLSYTIGSICFYTILFTSKASSFYVVILFAAGLCGSFFYTGGPGMKYCALGDVLVMLTFGPVAVLYAYIVQMGRFSWQPLVYSIPLMLNTEAILHGNNSRDIDGDKIAGILTLAIVLGKKYSYLLYLLLLFSPYLFLIVLSVTSTKLFFLPFFTLSLALDLEQRSRLGDLKFIPRDTAKLNLVFGILYVSVFLLNDI